jgi:protein SCO1/2
MAAVAVVLWVLATLFWWAFAFMPLPSEPAPWLAAARAACFDTGASGLPGAAGWLLLALAPVSSLTAILALWGREVPALLRRAARDPWGRGLLVVAALVVIVEGGWVSAKLGAAWHAASGERTAASGTGTMPVDYPRDATAAADFTLVDQHGAALALGDLRGRAVLLTFVFGHCASLCPVVVETVKRAVRDDAASVGLLVTLDPWRDTPSTLPAIARQWNLPPRIHVLSSRRADDVLGVARAYAVPFQRDEATGEIAHPGLVFVIDPHGRRAFTVNNPSSTWLRQALARLD